MDLDGDVIIRIDNANSTGTGREHSGLYWSPNGRYFSYTRFDINNDERGFVEVYDTQTRAIISTIEVDLINGPTVLDPVVWDSRSDTVLYISNINSTLYFYSTQAGSVSEVAVPDGRVVTAFWSESSRRWGYLSVGSEQNLFLLDEDFTAGVELYRAANYTFEYFVW